MGKRIVFMGTPEFAVESLKQLHQSGIEICAVVTVPDKPAGRGQQLSESAVKKYAMENQLPILQPVALKSEEFIDELKKINADLFVVVAFRMLPEIVWSMPKYGTINLHASLLPQYRGAAPINWAVINGDLKTGATTFFIEKEIDTGKIIGQIEIDINETDNAGNIHDKLMFSGAKLLVQTVKDIFDEKAHGKPQSDFSSSNLLPAPKIFKDDCLIDWNNHVVIIYNMIRGLSPYPTAFTYFEKDGIKKSIKIFSSTFETDDKNNAGKLEIKNGHIYIGCDQGWIIPVELQLEGKKKMKISEFLNGFNLSDWSISK